jgi:hypothetical protein
LNQQKDKTEWKTGRFQRKYGYFLETWRNNLKIVNFIPLAPSVFLFFSSQLPISPILAFSNCPLNFLNF